MSVICCDPTMQFNPFWKILHIAPLYAAVCPNPEEKQQAQSDSLGSRSHWILTSRSIHVGWHHQWYSCNCKGLHRSVGGSHANLAYKSDACHNLHLWSEADRTVVSKCGINIPLRSESSLALDTLWRKHCIFIDRGLLNVHTATFSSGRLLKIPLCCSFSIFAARFQPWYAVASGTKCW